MSALSAIVGPGPKYISPTTPVLPTFVLCFIPNSFKYLEIVSAVLNSLKLSSGYLWKCLL